MRVIIKEFLQEHRWSERCLCKTLEVSRPTQRYLRKQRNDGTLVERITYWALRFKRAGYRKILDLLRDQDGIVLNKVVKAFLEDRGLTLFAVFDLAVKILDLLLKIVDFELANLLLDLKFGGHDGA